MTTHRIAQVRLASPRRLSVPPNLLETARSREAALAIALEEYYADRYVYVADHDDEYVFFVVGDERGIQCFAYQEDDNGDIELVGEPERVRPRQSYSPATRGGSMNSHAFEQYKREFRGKLPWIDRIVAAPGNRFSQAELTAMSVGELQKMASVVDSVPVAAGWNDPADHFAPVLAPLGGWVTSRPCSPPP
jgi:hypothetical protein